MNGTENDEEMSGGMNDEVTKSRWRKMMPDSGIRKISLKKSKFKVGKMKLRGGKSKTGKGPMGRETDSSQLSLREYILSRGKKS